MIAVDTNVLVPAHRRDAERHRQAVRRIRELAEGVAPWAIPWHCLHEFVAVVTHPRIFAPPSTVAEAIGQLDAWIESPSLVLLSEDAAYWGVLRRLLSESGVTGARVHDARVAAVCLAGGVSVLWTADRDFGWFPDVTTRNPLVLED